MHVFKYTYIDTRVGVFCGCTISVGSNLLLIEEIWLRS